MAGNREAFYKIYPHMRPKEDMVVDSMTKDENTKSIDKVVDLAKKSQEVSNNTGILTEGEVEYLNWVKPRENNKFWPKEKTGWDKKLNLWFPHKSPEAGTDTIGYGTKLTKEEEKSGKIKIGDKLVDFTDGLTEDQATQLLHEDMKVHTNKARKVYDHRYGKGSFDKLDEDGQLLLTDFSYNMGPGVWDKNKKDFKGGLSDYKLMMKALHEGDWDEVGRQSIRRFKNPNTGLWEEMTDRNTATYDMFIKDNVTFK